jgi:transcriptional antiterminator
MSNHLGDTNKMVSETPRMDSAGGHARGIVDAAILAEGIKLERELNASTSEIERLTNKVAQLYEGAEEQKQRIKRLEEQNFTLRARLYSTRPRIPIEKKLAIADAPQNISISELARKFDVSYGTVARYRRQIKAKEAKL